MSADRRLVAIACLVPFLIGCGGGGSAPHRKSQPRASSGSGSGGAASKQSAGSADSGAAESPVNANGPILKVAVMRDGRILADGKPSSVEALRKAFKKLAEQHGTVLYYREAADKEPPPVAMEVIQAVIDARLPISFSTSPDFSNAIGPDGKPVPVRPSR